MRIDALPPHFGAMPAALNEGVIDMRRMILAVALACAAPAAFAEDSMQAGGDSIQQGAESVTAGASVAGAGSGALATGNSAAAVVSIPMGGAMMAGGSAQIVGGTALAASGAAGAGASAAIDALFSAPVVVTRTTIVAQPAPTVPYEAQTR